MDHLIYLSMAAAQANLQRQDALAGNLANASTNGFRAELDAFRAVPVQGSGASTRAYALETNDPAEVLSRLDRKVQLFEPSAMATAVYAVIDPARTTVSFSVAGHPPPVLLAYGSPGRLLDAHADLPLGAFPQAVRTSASVAT